MAHIAVKRSTTTAEVEAALPSSVVSDSSRIDMCRTWGCAPGHDNTKLIAEALAAAITAGESEINLYFSVPGIYPIEGASKTGEAFNTKYAGQILLPARSATEGRITVKISGPTAPAQPWFFSNNEPSADAPGVVLKSTATTGYVFDITPGLEVTTPTIKGFSNMLVEFENVIIQVPDNPQCGGVNVANALQFISRNFSVEVAATNEGSNTFPTGTLAGLVLPHTGNKGLVHLYDTYVYGFPVGVGIYEHGVFDGLIIQRCAVGIDCLGQGHLNTFAYVDVERCPVGLRAKNEGECGGAVEGVLDWENNEVGEWATKYILDEEYSGRLRGRLAVYPFSNTGRGFPARVAPATLNLCNPYYGSVGHRESYPLDECTRIANVAGNLGICNLSSHPYYPLTGKMTTENGALLSEEAAAISMAKVIFKALGLGQRFIRATIATRATGTYNVGIIANSVVAGSKEGNKLIVNLTGGKVKLLKEVSGARTTLAEGGTVANGTTYKLVVQPIFTAPGGTPTEVKAWLNGTEVFAYKLLTADREGLEDTQEVLLQDGVRWAEDNQSKITRFQVAPE